MYIYFDTEPLPCGNRLYTPVFFVTLCIYKFLVEEDIFPFRLLIQNEKD